MQACGVESQVASNRIKGALAGVALLSSISCTERSPVQLPVRALAQVTGLIHSQGVGSNQAKVFPLTAQGLLPEWDVFLLIPTLGLQCCPPTQEEEAGTAIART